MKCISKVRNVALASTAIWLAACGSVDGDAQLEADEQLEADGEGDAWAEQDFLPGEARSSEQALGASPEPMAYPNADGELVGRSTGTRWFRWTKGESVKTLMPISTHICGLGMVRGEMARNSNVQIFRSGSNWAMRGTSTGSNTLQMDAVCEPLSAFRVDAGRTVSIGSDFFATTGSDNSNVVTPMTARTTAVLRSVVGGMEGHGERMRVTVLPTVEVKLGTQDGTHAAHATSLSFGLASGETPFYQDETVSRTMSVNICPVIFGNCVYSDTRNIAPLASTFCYLSSVSGDFNGANEWAQVFPDAATGRWKLQATATSGNGVTASAECVLLDQRHSFNNPS